MDDATNDVQGDDKEAAEEQTLDNMEAAEEQALDDMKVEEELSEEEETAEEVETVINLDIDNKAEEFRSIEPDFDLQWTYFIEIYPWHDEDMNEKFIKLIRLSDFCRVAMRKKKRSHEKADTGEEKTKQASHEKNDGDDVETEKTHNTRKMGCLQFYFIDQRSAKHVMRGLCWKSMATKQITVEITRRDPANKSLPFETAYLELNTYQLCKCRFRVRATGELKDRSTRVSNIPGEITKGFLEVALTRATAVFGDASDKSVAANPLQKLEDTHDFKGILEFDCMTRGSARAFVQAHKRVVLNGQECTIVAVDEKTMEEPIPSIPNPNSKKCRKTRLKNAAKANLVADQVEENGTWGRGPPVGKQQAKGNKPFLPKRNGPGRHPEPMTGRRKMNMKMQREIGFESPNPYTNSVSGSADWMVHRGRPMPMTDLYTDINSIEDTDSGSVAQIAHLHTQLTASTMALQNNFALLTGIDRLPDMNFGFDDQTIGYDDPIDDYNDYNDLSADFNDMPRNFNSRSSHGWVNTHNGRSGRRGFRARKRKKQ